MNDARKIPGRLVLSEHRITLREMRKATTEPGGKSVGKDRRKLTPGFLEALQFYTSVTVRIGVSLLLLRPDMPWISARHSALAGNYRFLHWGRPGCLECL